MASQTRPGATVCSSDLVRRPSGVGAFGKRSRAKAKITITIAANGRTWLRATRLRHSTRRSLPATSAAVRTPSRTSRHRLHDLAGHDVDGAGGQRAGPLELVAGDDHRRPGRGRPGAAWRRARRDRRRRGRRAARRAATAGPGGRRGRPARCAAADRPTAGARAGRRGGRRGRGGPSPRPARRRVAPTVAPQKRTFSATVRSR